jgi:hypothetical protein
MTPFKLAWKITQFVFVVIPGTLWFGGLFTISCYAKWHDGRVAKAQKAKEDREFENNLPSYLAQQKANGWVVNTACPPSITFFDAAPDTPEKRYWQRMQQKCGRL